MTEERTGRAALLVGAGIFTSRVVGLVRQRVIAHYLGASAVNDAFQTAFRIPNVLQNLLGEGVLSASFIPEYAGTLARGDRRTADALAGAVFSALALIAAVTVAVGVLAAPAIVRLVAGGGKTPEQFALFVQLVRILFPGAALFVFSAWCLGVLNSHRRFLLSYMAPVAWNLSMIAALLIFGRMLAPARLVLVVAWASVVGSAAQVAVQLPTVVRVARGIRPNMGFHLPEVRSVFRQFTSVVLSRGVVQLSAFIDLGIANRLPIGTVSLIGFAQNLYLLPGSLFGMSVSAAEIPAMSSALGTPDEIAALLRRRLNAGMERIAFYVVPCVIAFLALGDIVTAAYLQTGRFTRADTIATWQILAGSTVGLLASTLGRLDASTYYALRDTRTPLRFAVMRIVVTTVLGIVAAFWLPRWLGVDARFGAVGLTASAGLAGWLEFIMLRRGLNRRIGRTGLRPRYVALLWVAGLAAALVASAARLLVTPDRTLVLAGIALPTFGIVYVALAVVLRVPEAQLITAKLRARARV